ncbi:MAG: hypothetical protein UR31_C0031G0006 [Parcubacteria group bacterium GW2011_GWA2_33_14]|nr:MAG: hypothetical protein UR31_C0031G0006 [Parcubacteria group bacterium GW2011_GWA2_33_14]OGZ70789.1 MAG: hypothetical protein A2980_02040 [Candidatus Staskawiczbacteria bacterium RIFCSPLOWO2_01_FULL_33_13]
MSAIYSREPGSEQDPPEIENKLKFRNPDAQKLYEEKLAKIKGLKRESPESIAYQIEELQKRIRIFDDQITPVKRESNSKLEGENDIKKEKQLSIDRAKQKREEKELELKSLEEELNLLREESGFGSGEGLMGFMDDGMLGIVIPAEKLLSWITFGKFKASLGKRFYEFLGKEDKIIEKKEKLIKEIEDLKKNL